MKLFIAFTQSAFRRGDSLYEFASDEKGWHAGILYADQIFAESPVKLGQPWISAENFRETSLCDRAFKNIIFKTFPFAQRKIIVSDSKNCAGVLSGYQVIHSAEHTAPFYFNKLMHTIGTGLIFCGALGHYSWLILWGIRSLLNTFVLKQTNF